MIKLKNIRVNAKTLHCQFFIGTFHIREKHLVNRSMNWGFLSSLLTLDDKSRYCNGFSLDAYSTKNKKNLIDMNRHVL